MRNGLVVFCLLAVAGSVGPGPGDVLAQSSGWSNVKPGTQMCRDANGKTYLSDKPCETFYKCYDDKGKLYSTTSPCPKPVEISPAEAARNRAEAERKREETNRRLRDRHPAAWKDLEKQMGRDISKCRVTEGAKVLIATCS